jgi:hypothetical protein
MDKKNKKKGGVFSTFQLFGINRNIYINFNRLAIENFFNSFQLVSTF